MNQTAVYIKTGGAIERFINCHASVLADFITETTDIYLNCPADATHIINNEPVTIVPEPAPPTEQEIIAGLVNAVQRHLDITARTRNYDGILSLCTYATSLDPIFSGEGQAGVVWRDACWRYSYQVMADTQAQLRTVPTPAELVAELPAMVWP